VLCQLSYARKEKSRAHRRDKGLLHPGSEMQQAGGGHCLDALVCAAKRRAPTACLFTACNRVEGGGAHRSALRAVDQHGTGDKGAGAKARNDDQGGHGLHSLCFDLGGAGGADQVRPVLVPVVGQQVPQTHGRLKSHQQVSPLRRDWPVLWVTIRHCPFRQGRRFHADAPSGFGLATNRSDNLFDSLRCVHKSHLRLHLITCQGIA
jgi:hypothetical protein